MHFRFCWLWLNYHFIICSSVFCFFFISPLLTAMHLINYNVEKRGNKSLHSIYFTSITQKKRCSRRCGCWHSVILRDGGDRSTRGETTDLGQATTTLS